MRSRIEQTLGPVDILGSSAGGSFSKPGPLEALEEGAWHATIDGNLTATFLTIKSFLPGLKARNRSAIVTISSSAGRVAQARAPVAYSAAKAGVQALTQVVAAQAGPNGVRANCVAPDTILTERNDQHIPTDMKKTMAVQHPVQRLGTPEDVAQAVVYLVSDDASWITGVIFDVASGAIYDLKEQSMHCVIRSGEIAPSPGGTITFEGAPHGSGVSFFLVNNKPGTGPDLHTHPYSETFIVRSSQARFTVDGRDIDAGPGDIVIVEPDTPHTFKNIGAERLDMVCIHAAPTMETVWLDTDEKGA